MKKEIEVYVWIDNQLFTNIVELDYQDEGEFEELANSTSRDFCTQLTEGLDYGWGVLDV